MTKKRAVSTRRAKKGGKKPPKVGFLNRHQTKLDLLLRAIAAGAMILHAAAAFSGGHAPPPIELAE